MNEHKGRTGVGRGREGVAGEGCKRESRQLQAFLSGGFDYLELGGKGAGRGVVEEVLMYQVDIAVFKDVGREGSRKDWLVVKAGWWETGGQWSLGIPKSS